MSDSVIGVLLSGQLLLVAWEIIKGVIAHKEKLKECKIKEDDVHKMVFRLYKDNLKQRIVDLFDKVNSTNDDVRADLMDLHEDVVIYFNNGGNGTVKKLYNDLADLVKEKRGATEYSIMLLDES